MKKVQQIIRTFLILAVMSSNLLAGDYADLKFIGFSGNGKYLAFEESGEWDGSGGDYATTYYVETAKNSYAAAPSVFEWSLDSSAKSRTLLLSGYKRKVAAGLKRFGIVPGNDGQLVVAHLLSDMSFVKPVKRKHYFYEDGKNESVDKLVTDYEGAFIRRDTLEIEKVIFSTGIDSYNQNTEEFYELTLIPTIAKENESCSGGYKIELTLQDNTGHRTHDLQILQKDADVLPKSRQCPYGYKIERVYVYQNKIAVFLNVFGQGFEGPDMRYLVVTGEIK
jgi:predicted secreted protein